MDGRTETIIVSPSVLKKNNVGITTFCTLHLLVHLGVSSYWVILHAFCRLLIVFRKLFQEYHQRVKQFGPRSGRTSCRA